MQIIGLFFVLLQLVSGQCQNPVVRQEWRQLSPSQQQAYLAAATAVKKRAFTGDENSDPATWNQDFFTQIHWKYQQNNHGKPAFMPWHRKFIGGYESALQSVDPSVSLPYWDWRLDSQNPSGSDLFLANHFGGNGDPSNNNCVPNGIASGWISVQGPNSNQCLKRCSEWKVLFSPQSVAALIGGGSDFNSFATSIEGGPHANVHNQMGGTCGDFSSLASCNDPVFFLHHAMVDKTWWVWQKSCSAFSQLGPGNANFPPFGNVDTFSTTSNGFCYSYSKNAGDAPFTMNCPSGQVDPWTGATATSSAGSTATATSAGATTTPVSPAAALWLQNAIQVLISIPSVAKVVQNSIHAAGPHVGLRKRDSVVNTTLTKAEADEDFCHWWGNIRCATYAPDSMLRDMMMFSEEQIKYINSLKPVTCAAVQAVNADSTQNSTASLMYFNQHNPNSGWMPPKEC